MNSNWFLYGPFPFEASAVAGSARFALGDLVEQYQAEARWSRLHHCAVSADKPGRSDGRAAGLYLLLQADEDVGPFQPNKPPVVAALSAKPKLVGFWVVFGRSYLGEGVVGPPDREPPYAQGLLDACTEEVWWNNLDVHPRKGGVWTPAMVFEWPSEMAFRSTLPPPGIPLSPDEYAETDVGGNIRDGDWLESLDEETIREEHQRAEAIRAASPWMDFSPHRSLLMLCQGKLHRKRASHEGQYWMVSPAWLAEGGETELRPLDAWLGRLINEEGEGPQELERHERGQPFALPGGHVGFAISGWLTRNLTVWPNTPADIQKGVLSPRDIGSRLLAQFQQASAVTALVLLLLVILSWVVFLLTKPPLVAVNPPPEITPEPAMSVCSADHQKFMDEFRCQIEAFAYGVDTDAPVCGDKGSNSLTRTTAYDLQAEYCGLLHRGDDGWQWPGGTEQQVSFNYAYVAASKACFNVLGHPYNYRLPENFSDAARQEFPNPDLFLTDPDLAIRGLSLLVSTLDSSCDVYRDRLESQVSGAVFATHVGAQPSTDSRDYTNFRDEDTALRMYLADQATQGTKRELRDCFYDGMARGVTGPERMAELCGFLPADLTDVGGDDPFSVGSVSGQISPEIRERQMKNQVYDQQKIWQGLYGQGAARSILDVTGVSRRLSGVVERYDYARFGNPLLPNQGQRMEALWACHGNLSATPDARLDTAYEPTLWDLSVPVPNTYRVEGAGVKTQIALDATLRALEQEPGMSDRAGPCWQVTARRLSRYSPVHPLLAETDASGWPSVEQQVCGQICAARYRIQARPPAAPNSPPLSEWVTPDMDLNMCVSTSGPVSAVLQGHVRRIRALNVESSEATAQFADLRERLVDAVRPTPQGNYTPFGGSGVLDRLRVPWNHRAEVDMEKLAQSFSNAIRRMDPSHCERISLNEDLFTPLSSSSNGSPSEICASEYRMLTENEQRMCGRYRQLSRRLDDLQMECEVAAQVGGGRSLGAQDLEDYLAARIQLAESWLPPSDEQICAFNLIAQGYIHNEEALLLSGNVAPPAWSGDTRPGSRIAGGGLGAKEAEGLSYKSATDMSRFGRTRSVKSCSFVATQCFTELLLDVSGNPEHKPFDWKDQWSMRVVSHIAQLDRRGASQLQEISPWCSLIQPYIDLQPGDIDYPCASGVDEARRAVSQSIDFLSVQYQTATPGVP